jgi:uncharacterized coiled-coil DUF342 family protein
MQVDFDDIIQYNIYLKDIAESNTAIGKVEEKNRRFKELEEAIDLKEQEEKECLKEMEGIYRRLGKALLDNETYNDFTSLFKEQADALSSKLESLESRIKELENKEGGNVFSWIGKSAQGLVLRSFLSKAQESQEQLFLNIGERYSDRLTNEEGKTGDSSTGDDIAALREEIDKVRGVSREIENDL